MKLKVSIDPGVYNLLDITRNFRNKPNKNINIQTIMEEILKAAYPEVKNIYAQDLKTNIHGICIGTNYSQYYVDIDDPDSFIKKYKNRTKGYGKGRKLNHFMTLSIIFNEAIIRGLIKLKGINGDIIRFEYEKLNYERTLKNFRKMFNLKHIIEYGTHLNRIKGFSSGTIMSMVSRLFLASGKEWNGNRFVSIREKAQQLGCSVNYRWLKLSGF